MTEQRPFRSKPFLYRCLAGIFIAEFCFLGFAFFKCSQPIPGQPVPLLASRCPELGNRTQEIFALGLSVVLSLLTGAADPTIK